MERQFIIYSKLLLEDNAFYNKMESTTDDSKYLFKAKTTQAYAVRSTFELCNAGLSDATMEFSPSGIKLTTVNNTVICKTLVCLKLKSENFDEFICNEEIDVPITLAHFYRVLKSVSKKNKYLMIAIKRDNPSALEVSTMDDGGPSKLYVEIQAFPKYDVDNIDLSHYNHPIEINSTHFQKVCKELGTFSKNTMELYSDGRILKFSAESKRFYSMTKTLITQNEDETADMIDYCKKFEMKIMNQLQKIPSLNTTVKFYIPYENSEDLPLKIVSSIGNPELGTIEFNIKTIEQISANH